MVGNLPARVGDVGLIPGQGTEIPLAISQLSPCTTVTEPACPRAPALQQEKTAVRSPRATPREQPHTLRRRKLVRSSQELRTTVETQYSQKKTEMFKKKEAPALF